MDPDFPAYQRLHQRIKQLATRWVLAWGEYGYRGGACNAHFSEAYGAGEHPFGERIEFYAPYVDGRGREGWMSSKYFDDDSTLEVDSKAWYDAEQATAKARSKRICELENSPDVRAYRELNSSYALKLFP